MSRSLISFDTDRIKQYVFATNTLKEIRGASAILDELNRTRMYQEICKIDPSAICIFANGGSALFDTDRSLADQCIERIEGLYRDETVTGSISGSSVQYNPDKPNIGDTFELLSVLLRKRKNEKPGIIDPVTLSFFRPCYSCGIEYATIKDQDEYLCESCYKKREKDKKIKSRIVTFLNSNKTLKKNDENDTWLWILNECFMQQIFDDNHILRPDSFEDIGELSSPKGYMGLIYADGNGMGQNISKINTIDDFKKFASVVDTGMRMAVVDAIKSNLQPKEHILPFDILMLGGDDLVMVTTADKAIETAVQITESFNHYTKVNWYTGMNVSIGVTIAHVKFPFNSLLHLTENLLKFSKRAAAIKTLNEKNAFNTDESLINFQVINSSNSLDFFEMFNRTLKQKFDERTFVRTLRPYTPKDLKENLIEGIRKLKAINFPKNKISGLREAVFMDPYNSEMKGLMIYNRLKKEERQKLMNLFKIFSGASKDHIIPWFKENDEDNLYVTPFLDIEELYDFIG